MIYDCTSGYPVPFEDICLLELSRLRELYSDRVKAIGFSGHHLGIAVDSAAVALGAEWIERHYTLDRTWKGTDHAASLEPDGVRKLVRDCRAVAKALTYKSKDVLDIEEINSFKYIKAVSLLKSRVDTAFMVGEECLVSDCSVVEVILSWLLVLPASVHGFYFGLQYKLP